MCKLLLGLMAVVFGLSSASAEPNPSGYYINLDLVKKVVCPKGDETYLGTAFFVGPNKLMTASHVIHDLECTIDGKPITVLEDNVALDYAVVTYEAGNVEYMNIACEQFTKGRVYLGVGWALGADFAVQRFVASDSREDQKEFVGQIRLVGKSFPGMSGGPIIDDKGFVVGLTSGGDGDGRAIMVTRPMLDTSACR